MHSSFPHGPNSHHGLIIPHGLTVTQYWMSATGQYSMQQMQQMCINQPSIAIYYLLQCNQWILITSSKLICSSVLLAQLLSLSASVSIFGARLPSHTCAGLRVSLICSDYAWP